MKANLYSNSTYNQINNLNKNQQNMKTTIRIHNESTILYRVIRH